MENLKRPNAIKVRFNNEELSRLNHQVQVSGMSREAYVRSLVNGYIPRGKPTHDYLDMIIELRRIGNNLNQIAMIANKTNSIDILRYKKEVTELKESVFKIQLIANKPTSIQ